MSAIRERVLSRGGDRVARLDARPVPHWVIVRALRRAIALRFDPVAAGELSAVFELRVRDPGGGEPAKFALAVSDGTCSVTRGPATRPNASVTVGAGDVIRMVSGASGWPELLATGRLELAGDPFTALRFPQLFRLPAG
jgi:hypothetical protein